MQLVPGTRDKYRLIADGLIIIVIIFSTLGAVVLGQRAGNNIRGELGERSQSIAAALDSDQVLRLSGTSRDETSITYKDLKARLADIKRANRTARSLYVTGERNGRLFFYVDSEQPSSDQYSPAGQYYDDATPGFKAIFKNGKPLLEGPLHDDFGTFISGLAPMFRPGSTQVVAVLGVDVDATTYYRNMFAAASLPVLAGLILIIIIVVFEWMRRRNQQLMTVRSELVSVASHELRTPIIGIRLAAENLDHMPLDPSAKAMVRVMYDSARRLQTSTDDILELTRSMQKQSLAMAEVDMMALFNEIVTVQQVAAQQKGVRLLYAAPWPAQLTVRCDADKIKRALHNVVSNAIKYTKDNSLVTIGYKSDEQNHYFTVADQGIGIPQAEVAKVFAGFYRASNAVSSKVPGTGLGLFLVKGVMEQHGGSVSCISEQDKGTIFTLTLPKRD